MAAITKTTAGINLLRDGESGANTPVITYFSIGTSATSPTASDTKLGAEVFRKKVSTYANGSSPGEIIVSGQLAGGDAVGVNIAEVAFWGGNATSVKDSGVMIARGLYSHPNKQNNETITFTLDQTIS